MRTQLVEKLALAREAELMAAARFFAVLRMTTCGGGAVGWSVG
jgi:hypothetical protein